MTAFAVCCFVMLLALCGIVPALTLLPGDPRGHRVLLLPFLGLCFGILATYSLAAFGLTGQTIALTTLVVFPLAAISLAASWRLVKWEWITSSRIRREELKGAIAPLLSGATTVLLIAWPLLYKGYAEYWGFANPDQPFYMTILKYLHTHSFGLPLSAAGVDRS